MREVIGFRKATTLDEYAYIGQTIVENNPKIYNEKVIRTLEESIEKNSPDSTEKQKKEIMFQSVYCYWAYGAIVDEFFSYKFYKLPIAEAKNYMTAHVREVYLKERLSKLEDAHLLENKYEAYELLRPYYKRDAVLIENESDYGKFKKFVIKHSVFVVKPVDENMARGIHKAEVTKFDDDYLHGVFTSLLKEGVDAREKFDYGTEKAIMLEELLIQDPQIAAVHPESVNAVRATTVRIGEKVFLYNPWFKIGRGGKFVNSGATGGFLSLIDSKTGIALTPACSENGEEYDFHPETNVRVKGFQIPKWDELVATVTELALKLPTIRIYRMGYGVD